MTAATFTAGAEADLEEALLNSRKVEAIIAAVAQRYKFDPKQVTGRTQSPRIMEARTMALALCVALTTATHAQIGQRFMGRARACVARAVRQHAERLESADFNYRQCMLGVACDVAEALR
jgi:chromosomal replication initiation ATPase DnaA